MGCCDMYAIFETGGQQHRVVPGETLKVQLLEAAPGDAIEFSNIMLLSKDGETKVGAPFVDGGVIKAEVVAHGRHKKIQVLKFRRRKHHMKQMGHRQWFTEIKINEIAG